jgi:flagellar assembly protein FliH
LLDLSCAIARQVVRNELSINPNAIQPVIREALGTLLADAKVALVRLNPRDLDLIKEAIAQEFPNLTLTLVPDSALSRGGCLVESAGSVIDGTLERRWQRAVASLGLDDAFADAGLADGMSQDVESGGLDERDL